MWPQVPEGQVRFWGFCWGCKARAEAPALAETGLGEFAGSLLGEIRWEL